VSDAARNPNPHSALIGQDARHGRRFDSTVSVCRWICMLIHSETPPPSPEPVKPVPEPGAILTLKEAAVLLCRHPETVRLMVRRGEAPVPVIKIGRRHHMLRADVEAFLAPHGPAA
jgi:Helix-turn-helix domain